MDTETFIALLVGAAIGALPSLVSYWYKQKRELDLSHNKALFALLNIRYWASRIYPRMNDKQAQSFTDEIMNIIDTKYTGILNDDEREVIVEYLFQTVHCFHSGMANNTNQDGLKQHSSYLEEAVNILAEHQPTLAYFISGQGELINNIQMMEKAFQHWVDTATSTNDSSIQDIQEATEAIKQATKDIFDPLLLEQLNTCINKVAEHCPASVQRSLSTDINDPFSDKVELGEDIRKRIEDWLDHTLLAIQAPKDQ